MIYRSNMQVDSLRRHVQYDCASCRKTIGLAFKEQTAVSLFAALKVSGAEYFGEHILCPECGEQYRIQSKPVGEVRFESAPKTTLQEMLVSGVSVEDYEIRRVRAFHEAQDVGRSANGNPMTLHGASILCDQPNPDEIILTRDGPTDRALKPIIFLHEQGCTGEIVDPPPAKLHWKTRQKLEREKDAAK